MQNVSGGMSTTGQYLTVQHALLSGGRRVLEYLDIISSAGVPGYLIYRESALGFSYPSDTGM